MPVLHHKPLEELSYEEMVDEATREIHDGLLQNGSVGMRRAIHTYLSTALRWKEAQDKRNRS